TLTGHTGAVHSVAFSPDGKRLASGSEDRTVKLWYVRTGKECRTLKGHSTCVNHVAFSPDDKRLASSDNSTLKVWDVQTAQVLYTLQGYDPAFSSDGTRLANVSNDGRSLQVWESQSGAHIVSLKGRSERITTVTFSPQGKRLVSG